FCKQKTAYELFTGVQTCALPIWARQLVAKARRHGARGAQAILLAEPLLRVAQTLAVVVVEPRGEDRKARDRGGQGPLVGEVRPRSEERRAARGGRSGRGACL